LKLSALTVPQVWFIILPMPVFTLAFGGIMVPKLNLFVRIDLVYVKALADLVVL
jgi:hypothetical protein